MAGYSAGAVSHRVTYSGFELSTPQPKCRSTMWGFADNTAGMVKRREVMGQYDSLSPSFQEESMRVILFLLSPCIFIPYAAI